MSIPSHFPTPKIKGMEVSEIERFVPTSLSRGVEGKSGLSAAKVVAANLRHSIFAKFNQIVHRILNGEWVTKKAVRESIKSNIHRLSLDLEARQYESRDKLDEKIEVRTWIHTSVDSLRRLCNQLKEMGIKEVDEFTDALKELDRINDQEGIKEVENWNDYHARHSIQEELSRLINTAYEAESFIPPKGKTPISLLGSKLGGKDSPLNQELQQLAESDFTDAHHLFIVDQVRRAWGIIFSGFKPEIPPNEVSIQFKKLMEEVARLSPTQKFVEDEEEISAIQDIQKIEDENKLRTVFKDELQKLLTSVEKKLDGKQLKNPIIIAVKNKDFHKKDAGSLANNLREFQELLNKIYRAKGERLSDNIYNRLAALYTCIDCLEAMRITHTPSMPVQDEAPIQVINLSFPIDPMEQRQLIGQTLNDFIKKAYEIPVPKSDPPLSYLQKHLPPALNEELSTLTKVDFREAHNLLVIDTVTRALEIILLGFSKYENRDPQGIAQPLSLPLTILKHFLGQLKNMQKKPGDIPLEVMEQMRDKDRLRHDIQNEVKIVFELEKKILEEWKVKRGRWLKTDYEYDLIQIQKENFLALPPEDILKRIQTLHKAIYRECRTKKHDVPNDIYDHLAALYAMSIRLNDVARAERMAATVVLPPNPEQADWRVKIQKKLSSLIELAYSKEQTYVGGSRVPTSGLEQKLGGEASRQNTELQEIKSLDFTNVSNLLVIDLTDRVHEVLSKAFDDVLPEDLETLFEEIEELEGHLDNSQKGPLPPEIKQVSEIHVMEEKEELRNLLKENLIQFISVLERTGFSSSNRPIIPLLSPEGAVLVSLKTPKFSSIPPEKIWKTVNKLHSEVTKICRTNLNTYPSAYIYDQLSALYEMSEKLIELSSESS